MDKATREMTFEEEAELFEKEAMELFAKEDKSCEAPPVNQIVRRGMRIIRKARCEIGRICVDCNNYAPVRHGYWIKDAPYRDEDGYIIQQFYCSECGRYEDEKEPYCNCGCKMDLKENSYDYY